MDSGGLGPLGTSSSESRRVASGHLVFGGGDSLQHLDRVAECWNRGAEKAVQGNRGVSWLELPAIRAHINQCVSGDPEQNWVSYVLARHLRARLPLARCLSLGCGSGDLERELSGLDAYVRCDAFDLAPGAIRLAQKLAAEQGIDNVSYAVADVNKVDLAPTSYDAVWIDMALHHFDRLEHVCEQIARALTPGGLLVVNEYIGPDRFQFPARQKEVINRCLDLIPRHLRLGVPEFVADENDRRVGRRGIGWFSRRVIDKILDGDLLGVARRRAARWMAARRGQPLERTVSPFPTVRDLVAADPSEAVRSSEILAVLADHFEIVEERPWGGSLLHFLLGGIAGNFAAKNAGSLELLDAFIEIETALIRSGDLSNDFTVVVARPRPAATRGRA